MEWVHDVLGTTVGELLRDGAWSAIGAGVLGVGAGVLGTLMFGRGYKKKIAALEEQARASVTVNVSGAQAAPATEPTVKGVGGVVARHDERRGVLAIGTKKGVLQVRVDGAEQAERLQVDILDWLYDADLLATLDSSDRP